MILLDHLVRFVRDFPGVLHIFLRECGIDEVIVMRGEEHAALDTFRNPFLMHNRGRIVVAETQIEHGGFARHAEVEAVVLCDFFQTFGKNETLLLVLFDGVGRLCLFDGCDACREGDCGQPVAAGVHDVGSGVFEFLLTADGGNVVAVRDGFAEARDIGFDAVVIVTTFDVDTEARADVVENEDDAVVVAQLAHLLPVSFGRKLVVDESGMEIRRCDECRDLSGILFDEFLKLVGRVPIDVKVVGDVLFGDAGIAQFLHPGRHAVIVALDEDDFLAVSVSTGNHDCKVGRVAAVLCEERPVRHVDGVDHFFREIDEQVGRQGRAVAFFELFDCGGVDIGVVVAQEVGAVRAHIVDELVSVDIPEVRSLGFGHEQRIRADGNHAAFGGAEVSVNACGHDFERALEGFLAFAYIIYFLGTILKVHCSLLLMRDKC